MKKLKLPLLFAIPITGVLDFFKIYVFDDFEFVKYLVVLMVVDTLLGLLKHWIKKDISSKGYGMVAKKLIVYTSVMVLTHVISDFKVANQAVDVMAWFRTFGCSMLMIREGLSIIENIEGVFPGFFPQSVINRFKDFDGGEIK